MGTKEDRDHYFSHRPTPTDEDIQYFVYVTDAIEHGLADVARAKTISQDEMRARARNKWGTQPAT